MARLQGTCQLALQFTKPHTSCGLHIAVMIYILAWHSDIRPSVILDGGISLKRGDQHFNQTLSTVGDPSIADGPYPIS